MGLFSKLGGGNEINLTPQGGLLLAAITMTAIDGDVDDNEMAIIHRLDGSGNTGNWEAAVKAWKTNSIEQCVQLAANSMSDEQQLIAMANLIDIAMADGMLGNNEKALLEVYVDAFNVNDEDVSKIVDVISVKNNKSAFV